MTYRETLVVAAIVFAALSNGTLGWAAPEEKTLEVNGTQLAFVEEGSGTPVVFVHGAISDLRIWDGYASEIANGWRFVAYTQRYFGTKDWSDDAKQFSRETHINDLIGFVEGLNAGPVHLVTWSYSGEIGTYAALRRPDLFRSIVHYEPSVGALVAGLPGGSVAQGEMFSHFGPAISAVKENRLEDAALRFLEAVFKLPQGAAGEDPKPWPTYWRENGRTIPPYLAMEPGAPLSCEDLGVLRMPTLVVQGENTYARYSMISERLADCQANALLVTLPGVNHDGPYRKPEEFGTLIRSFVALTD